MLNITDPIKVEEMKPGFWRFHAQCKDCGQELVGHGYEETGIDWELYAPKEKQNDPESCS